MGAVIRLMSDWGLPPFYTQDEPGGPFDLTDDETLQEMFGLPSAVIDMLLAWDQLYLDHLDWDDPPSTRWPSQEAQDHYVEQGRKAARCLRKHLPDDVAIEYQADGILVASEHY